MTTLCINLPEELKNRLETRAAESGFPSVEDYASALLRAEAEAPPLAAQEVEDLLRERMDDERPSIELTPEFKQQFRERVQVRRAGGDVRP